MYVTNRCTIYLLTDFPLRFALYFPWTVAKVENKKKIRGVGENFKVCIALKWETLPWSFILGSGRNINTINLSPHRCRCHCRSRQIVAWFIAHSSIKLLGTSLLWPLAVHTPYTFLPKYRGMFCAIVRNASLWPTNTSLNGQTTYQKLIYLLMEIATKVTLSQEKSSRWIKGKYSIIAQFAYLAIRHGLPILWRWFQEWLFAFIFGRTSNFNHNYSNFKFMPLLV